MRDRRDDRQDRRQDARFDRQEDRQRLRRERREDIARAQRQENRDDLRQRAERAERRADRLRDRRDDLRRELRQEQRDDRRDWVRREEQRRDRYRDWERSRRNETLERAAWAGLGAFAGAAIVASTQGRTTYVVEGQPLIVDEYPSRFGWRADAYDVRDLNNGWTESVVVRGDGSRIVTIVDNNGVPIRRYRVLPNGQTVTLFNNLPTWWDDRSSLEVNIGQVNVGMPYDRYVVEPSRAPVEVVYETVTAEPVQELDRAYTLNQVLYNEDLRALMPRIDVDTINFQSGSAYVDDSEIGNLETLGVAMEEAIYANPSEVFLIEGHTDAVGSPESNLVLSDARAESVAEILTEYFEIPPENIVTQGFGEQYLKEQTMGDSRTNRRVTVRRITPLLATDDQIAGLEDQNFD
ncbi:OmpA family protein [Acuticoccus yangtzensis]|uniref:OmpA family protein n=1 Tax=Acuticoccus yangtzensis TaxID=1443441 RepID=UPI000949A868|nr:OmpA family protein [Acuticoccus yangtzensis]